MAHFYGTSGDDTITGTKHADHFDMSQGGDDIVFGGGGADIFYYGDAFTASDQIDGGLTRVKHHAPEILSTVELNGDYSAGVVFGASTMINIAHIVLDAGHSYSLTTNAATVGFGQVLEVNATALGAGDTLVFNDSADTEGSILVESNAGSATIIGGTGNDNFVLGTSLNASDHIDGGGGANTLSLNGDYSGTVALDGSLLSNIQTIDLGAGTYSFTAADSLLASGKTLLIAGTFDTMANVNVTFDGSAETDGSFTFQYLSGNITGGQSADAFHNITGTVTGGGGNDFFESITGTVNMGDGSQVSVEFSSGTFNGGAGSDNYSDSSGTFNGGSGFQAFNECSGTFNLQNSSQVAFSAGDQATLYMGALLSSNDSVEGGGVTTIVLDGDYSAGLSLSNVSEIGLLTLTAGHSYNFTSGDYFAEIHDTATVDGSMLGAGDTLTFDGSANTKGMLAIYGGAGDDTLTGSSASASTLSGGGGRDTLTGGTASDTLIGGGGGDTLNGGSGGNDNFKYMAVSESSGVNYDTIIGFDVTRDHIVTPITVTGIDAIINGGVLNDGNAKEFNADLAAAADSAHLEAGHAVLFMADSGDLAGHIFLIVDQNGVAGYQTNQDLVIDVTQSSNITSLSLHDFH